VTKVGQTAAEVAVAWATVDHRGWRLTSMEGKHLVAKQPFRNPLGVHALVWVGDTCPASVDYAVAKTKETGYDLLELSLHDMRSLDVAAARSRLTDAGLRVVCSRGLTFDADISSDDPATVTRGEQLLSDSLRITAELGSTHLTGALYSALGKYSYPLSDAGRRNVVAVLGYLAKQARDYGITLGLEICNRYETNVVNTARQALALADDIGEDNILLHLDTYHMNIEEDDLARPVREVGDRLGYVHIGENHRGYLGAGHLDFTGFFHALADINYSGPITFESFSSAVIAAELSNHLAIWRNQWNDSEDLARHARSFIANHLAAANPS
jgi:D-psicose/D-tagatose/L-ribulose 3-epimerase